MFKTIDYQVANGIAEIRLNRPERHNAIDVQMGRELPQVWQAFNRDPGAIVAILTGSGQKTFCSGADIADIPELDFSSPEAAEASIKWTSRHNNIWKPVICAVNGMAIGGGLHFIADSDIVIAADHATFLDSHVSVGLVAGLEPVGLVRRMPMEAVLRMALMGGKEKMDAARALQTGLVGEVVPADQLMTRAREIAAIIAQNCPGAMARTKRAIWDAKQQSLDKALLNAWALMLENNAGPDFAEGTTAFLERRAPNWQPYDPDSNN